MTTNQPPATPRQRTSPTRRQVLTIGAGGLLTAGISAAWLVEHHKPAVTATIPSTGMGGHTALHFSDHFTSSTTIGVQGDANAQWFRSLPFGWGTTPASDLTVRDSVLRIEPSEARSNYSISTVAPNGEGNSFGHGYFEARIRFGSPAASTSGASPAWPAFWALTTNHITNPSEKTWDEIDFFEAVGEFNPQRYYGTMHQWGTKPANHVQSQPNYAEVNCNFHQWNTMGCLWNAERITWFLNRQELMHVDFGTARRPDPDAAGSTVGTFSRLSSTETKIALILGTGPGWPLEIDWVAVWQ